MSLAQTETATSVSAVKPLVEGLAPRFTRLSDEIWDQPELRWEEHGSMQRQIEAAEEFGGRIARGAGGAADRVHRGMGLRLAGDRLPRRVRRAGRA